MKIVRGRRCAIATTCLWLATCQSEPLREHKLLGKWIAPQTALIEQGQTEDEANEIALRQPHNTIETVYRADHTWYAAMVGEPPSVFGHWRIEGTDLITTVDRGPNAPRTERVHILELSEKKLVVSDGHSEGRVYRQR